MTKKTEITEEVKNTEATASAETVNPETTEAAADPVVLTPEEALAKLEAQYAEDKKRAVIVGGGIAAIGIAIGMGIGYLLFGRD